MTRDGCAEPDFDVVGVRSECQEVDRHAPTVRQVPGFRTS
jgi:hypothetical protein